MSKKIILLSMVMLLTLSLCAGIVNAKMVVRIAHDDPPSDNAEAHVISTVFKNLVEVRTNGELEVQIFPSMSMGTQGERVEMIQAGTLQVNFTSMSGIAPYMPEIGALDFPFLFPNDYVAQQVLDGPALKYLQGKFADKMGIYLAGIHKRGFYELSNNSRPVAALEDLDNLRIRVMASPSHIKLWDSLGASPTPISWSEVYTSLQTGVIDGQHNPLPIIIQANLYEVQKYVTLSNHIYASVFVTMSQDFLDELSAEQRVIVKQSMQEALTAGYGMNRISETTESIPYLQEKGMEFTSLSTDERERWKENTQPAMMDYYENEIGPEAIELLNVLQKAVKEVSN